MLVPNSETFFSARGAFGERHKIEEEVLFSCVERTSLFFHIHRHIDDADLRTIYRDEFQLVDC